MQPLGTDQAPGSSGGGTGVGDLSLRPGSRGTGNGRKPQGRRWSPWLTGLLLVLLAVAVAFGRMSAAGAIAAAVFGGAAFFFAERLVRSLDRGERASFESAWGGLGGGLGGWRLSTPLVYLVATAVFGTLLVVVAVQEMPGRATDEAGQREGGETPAGEKEADGEDGNAAEPAGAEETDEPEGESEDASEGAGTESGDDEASDALATGAAAAGTEAAPAAQP